MRRRSLLAAVVVCLGIATQAQPSRSTQIQFPISFEQNHGQTAAEVQFMARARNSTLFLTRTEAVLALRARPQNGNRESSALWLKWVGGNSRPEIVTETPLPGKINYMIGSDPTKWRVNLPTFARVRYRGIYPGVDAVFYGKDGEIEYDLDIASGFALDAIRFSVAGARSMRVASDGDLVLEMAGGEIRQRLPRVYQEVAGETRVLKAKHVIHADGTVGFAVEGLDPRHALTVDPTLSYSTLIGSATADQVQAVAVDQQGSVYATGTTTSGFPTKNPAQGNQLQADAFVTKFAPNGRTLIYSTYLGSHSSDGGTAIAVDRNGFAYVGGLLGAHDFPSTPGAFRPPEGQLDGQEAFVVKLSPSGSSIVYSAWLGGGDSDAIFALALDSQHRVYVTGGTCSENFSVKNAFQPNYSSQNCADGGFSAFIARLNAAGSDLDYSTYLDGSIASGGEGIAVDSTFHAYVAGWTQSSDFPTTAGAFQRTFKAAFVDEFPHGFFGNNGFVTKFSPDGQTLEYSTFLGGSVSDSISAISVDSSGRAYVTGGAESSDFPVTPGAFRTTLKGTSDAFVAKLWKTGGGLIYSTFIGGSQGDGASSIAVDSKGQAEIAGSTSSADFPLHSPLFSTAKGGADAFVAKLTASGKSLVFGTYLGGTKDDSANCIRLDAAGNAYIGGATGSSNFPTTPGAYSRTFKGGGTDGWVAKIVH